MHRKKISAPPYVFCAMLESSELFDFRFIFYVSGKIEIIMKQKRKKIILSLLLILIAVLAIYNKKNFLEEREYYNINMFEESYDLLSSENVNADGDIEVRQEFIARQKELNKVCIRFKIDSLVSLKGRLAVSIVDEEEQVIASTSVALSHLTQTETSGWTQFTLTTDQLEKGNTYTLVLKTRDASGEGQCSLYLSRNRLFLFKDLTLGGEADSRRIEATFKYNTYCEADLIKMLLLIIVTLLLLFFSETGRGKKAFKKLFSRHSAKKKNCLKASGTKDYNRLAARILFFLSPLAAYYMMQSFSGYDIPNFTEQVFTSPVGIINLLLYGGLLMICYMFTNRTKYAVTILMVVTYVAGLINYYVWEFRGCPIMATDLASIKTAANVADGYDYSMGLGATWATVLLACYLALTLALRSYKGMALKRRICVCIASVMFVLGTWGIFFHTDLMKRLDITVSVWMPERNYAANGSTLSFLLSWTYYVVEKPAGYSADRAVELAEGYESDTAILDNNGGDCDNSGNDGSDASSVDTSSPNIICIMNESFSDLGVDADLETNEDYMPFIHNLEENTVKGSLYVSVLGGNTANTEFEFLTGNSLAFFPTRSVPYNSYVKTQTGSLTWTLKSLGYSGLHAIHPYYSDGWNREVVYPLLGFSDFLDRDDFSNPTRVREFISDEADFNKLIEKYEEAKATSDAPFYEFSVTMQNHGGYSGIHGLVDEEIQVTNMEVDDQVTQYLNLIKESDTAFENLIHYFEKVDEPTIVVMFGDHQPGFTDSVYDSLLGAKTSSLGIEDTAKMYQTTYVIWANYDIEEAQLDMSANYLSSYLLKLAGQPLTGYNKYLLDMMEEIPVVSAICYIGDDGVIHAIDEESKYSDKLKEYQTIQYNNMFDTDNRIPDFFYLKDPS